MELTCSTWGEKLKRKRKMWRQTGFVQILPVDRGSGSCTTTSTRPLLATFPSLPSFLVTILSSPYGLLSLSPQQSISPSPFLSPLHHPPRLLLHYQYFLVTQLLQNIKVTCNIRRTFPGQLFGSGLLRPASDQLSTPWSQSVLKTELHCLTIVIVTHSLLYCSN